MTTKTGQLSSTSNNDYQHLGGSATKSSATTRFSKFYNHAAHGQVLTPSSALSENRVLQYINTESQGEKVVRQQEQVVLALDRAKIDLKKKGVIVEEQVPEPYWRRKKKTPAENEVVPEKVEPDPRAV